MPVEHYGVVKAQKAEWVEGVDTFISLQWKNSKIPSACPFSRQVVREVEIEEEQTSQVAIDLVDDIGKEDVYVQVVDSLPLSFSSLTQSLSKSKFGFTPINKNGIDYTVTLPNFPYNFTAQDSSKIGVTITEFLDGLDEQSCVYVLGNYTYSNQNVNFVHFNNYFVGEESWNNYSQKDGAVLVQKHGNWKGLFFSYNRQLQSWIRTHGDATTVPVYPGKLYMACGNEAVDTNSAETASLLNLRELPQPAVTSYPTPNQTYIIVYLKDGYNRNSVVDALVKVPRTYGHGCLVDSNTFGIFFYADYLQGQNPNDRLEIAIGFSPELWKEWGQDIPQDMRTFTERVTPDGKYKMPATGGDIALHLKGSRPELLQDIAAKFSELIKGQEEKIQVYNTYNGPSGRNSFGFFDAPTNSLPPCGLYQRLTQNPVYAFGPVESVTDRGRVHVSLIAEEENEKHKNGSFLLTQLYLFQMEKFNRLTEDQQSDVFGRDKQTGYFLNSGITNAVSKPTIPFCHVIRSSIALDDPPTKFAHIYRQAGSYVDPQGTPGLFFTSYVADCSIFDQTLDQMMGLVKPNGKEQGVDSMMEYVDTLSGQYFYIPNLSLLFKLWN